MRSQKVIADLQSEIETALAKLGQFPAAALPNSLELLRHLAPPPGFTAAVSLRYPSKRQIKSNASATNWDPKTGVIEIHFMPATAPPPGAVQASATVGSHSGVEGQADLQDAVRNGNAVTAIPSSVSDLVVALDAAERDSRYREFVGLKQFRDTYLTAFGFAWAADPGERHRAMTIAIEQGLVLKGSVVNPRLPDHSTATIRVNRNHLAADDLLQQRQGRLSTFCPIAIAGEPLSQTVLADRR